MEVDIREDTGWQEQVKYSEGFKLFNKERRSWKDAESLCQERGGHLASILSEEEHEELRTKAGTTIFWIGGSYKEEEAGFVWTDGYPWGYTSWGKGYGKTGEGRDCVYIRAKDWRESTCGTTRNFICNSNPHIVREQKKLTLKYTKEEITFSSFSVWYEYNVTGDQMLKEWKDKRMTGVKLTWFLKNIN